MTDGERADGRVLHGYQREGRQAGRIGVSSVAADLHARAHQWRRRATKERGLLSLEGLMEPLAASGIAEDGADRSPRQEVVAVSRDDDCSPNGVQGAHGLSSLLFWPRYHARALTLIAWLIASIGCPFVSVLMQPHVVNRHRSRSSRRGRRKHLFSAPMGIHEQCRLIIASFGDPCKP